MPLIMSLPGRRDRSLRVPQGVRLVDLLPTLLAAAGLPLPDGLQGVSLLPLIDAGAEPPGSVFSSWRRHGLQSLRIGDWKLIQRVGPQRGSNELYDLRGDPAERRNLAGEEPERVARMAQQLGLHLLGSRSRSVPGVKVQPSRETADRLRALGYLGLDTEKSD